MFKSANKPNKYTIIWTENVKRDRQIFIDTQSGRRTKKR